MKDQEFYINSILSDLEFSCLEDLIEGFFLHELVDSYSRIEKTKEIENRIRDRFIFDLLRRDSITRNLVDKRILQINPESYIYSETEIFGRADISFHLPGIQFIIECKCLSSADNQYFNNGLQRFIDLRYADGDIYAGMIGFITGGDIYTIKNKIKNKTQNYFPTAHHVDGICTNWPHSFKSSHHRIDNSDIVIYHMFFEFME